MGFFFAASLLRTLVGCYFFFMDVGSRAPTTGVEGKVKGQCGGGIEGKPVMR